MFSTQMVKHIQSNIESNEDQLDNLKKSRKSHWRASRDRQNDNNGILKNSEYRINSTFAEAHANMFKDRDKSSKGQEKRRSIINRTKST